MKNDRAVTAKIQSVSDKTYLRPVRSYGNTLIEEGRVTGTLPGTAKVRLTLQPEKLAATTSFTFHLGGGDLRGHGTGKAHSGEHGYESFSGAISVDGGTGRYANASGVGHFYGVLNRVNNNVEVQLIGRLRT